MPTNETELLRTARTIARLQTQCRKLRRQLKAAKADLRLERKHLKALGALTSEPRSDVFPSKVFGDGVGHLAEREPKAPGAVSVAAAEWVDELANSVVIPDTTKSE